MQLMNMLLGAITITVNYWTSTSCKPAVLTEKPFVNVCRMASMPTCLAKDEGVIDGI